MEEIVIIGAGPSGIASCLQLLKGHVKSRKIHVIDKNSQVGGLARTIRFKNHFFDVGPHRFYTKNQNIFMLWKSLLGKDFKKIKRLTRIYYKNKLFLYPIQIFDVITKLGVWESFLCLLSFLRAKMFFKKSPKSFEDWVILQFGKRLYNIFFKTYTEKVWGISCSKLSAKWATQRIKGLNFTSLITNTFKKNKVKSLISHFYYPVKGSGYMYEKAAERIKKQGGIFSLESKVIKIFHENNIVNFVTYRKNGKLYKKKLTQLFSSIPITDFINVLSPKPPKKILNAAKKLLYRDHITVNLLVKKSPFPDNWIYVHEQNVKIARITNYNTFVDRDRDDLSAISIEYFTFKSDRIWQMVDADIIDFAKKELNKLEILIESDVIDSFVIREESSYPAYYLGYESYFNEIFNFSHQFKNLQLIGRGGLYKYNNMDDAMLSGIHAARAYDKGNVARVNKGMKKVKEDDYLEEITKSN